MLEPCAREMEMCQKKDSKIVKRNDDDDDDYLVYTKLFLYCEATPTVYVTDTYVQH